MKKILQGDNQLQSLLQNNEKYKIASNSSQIRSQISLCQTARNFINKPSGCSRSSVQFKDLSLREKPQTPTQKNHDITPKTYFSNLSNIKKRQNDQKSTKNSLSSLLKKEKVNQAQSIQTVNIIQQELYDLTEDQLETYQKPIIDLNASFNNFKTIPQSIQNLGAQLQVLQLENNYIKNLPTNFSDIFQTLIKLNLSTNFINTLPRLPQTLESLHISYNMLSMLPMQPQGLKSLRVQGNPIFCLTELNEPIEEFAIEWGKYLNKVEILKDNDLKEFKSWLKQAKEKTFNNYVKMITHNTFNYYKQDSTGRTCLHQAAAIQDLGIIVGCEGHINPNMTDQQGMTPLYLSIKDECYKSAKFLLKIGANPSCANGPLGSVLTLVVKKQQFYLFNLIIQKGIDTNLQDHEGNSALHYLFALWRDTPDQKEAALQLLFNGACSNLRNKAGFAPLHMGIKNINSSAVDFAIRYNIPYLGGNNKICSHTFDLEIMTKISEQTPLQLAAQFNVPSIIYDLLNENVKCEGVRVPNSYGVSNKLLQRAQRSVISKFTGCNTFMSNPIHCGYKGFCKFQSQKEYTVQPSVSHQKQKNLSCDVNRQDTKLSQNVSAQQILQHSLKSKDKDKKQQLNTARFLQQKAYIQGMKGDSEISSASGSSQLNDSKSEQMGKYKQQIQSSSIGAFLQRKDNQGDQSRSQCPQVYLYSGTHIPKLSNSDSSLINALQQKWENIVQYFQSTGKHYQQEFLQQEQPLLKMKILTILLKLELQLNQAFKAIQFQQSKFVRNIVFERKAQVQKNCIQEYIIEIWKKYSLVSKENDLNNSSLVSEIQEEERCNLNEGLQPAFYQKAYAFMNSNELPDNKIQQPVRVQSWDQEVADLVSKKYQRIFLIEVLLSTNILNKELIKPYSKYESAIHQFEILQQRVPKQNIPQTINSPQSCLSSRTAASVQYFKSERGNKYSKMEKQR